MQRVIHQDLAAMRRDSHVKRHYGAAELVAALDECNREVADFSDGSAVIIQHYLQGHSGLVVGPATYVRDGSFPTAPAVLLHAAIRAAALRHRLRVSYSFVSHPPSFWVAVLVSCPSSSPGHAPVMLIVRPAWLPICLLRPRTLLGWLS